MPTTRSGRETGAGAAAEASTGDKHKMDSQSPPGAKSRKKGDGEEHGTLNGARQTEAEGGNTTALNDKSDRDDTLSGRGGVMPSNILEKGIIYFFFRGRVGVDEPHGVEDIGRSYIILRPIAKEAKLNGGAIDDAGTCRLCVLPKKVLPRTGRDRWIAFVEKTSASFATLRETFLASHDYTTKTAGTRHTPAATPFGEGIYAITSTGRESHLAYMLTLPRDLGDAQRDMGLKDKGSFIISTRNPHYPPPKYAQLPKGPEYPQEQVTPRLSNSAPLEGDSLTYRTRSVLDEFRSMRWIGTRPRHLDFADTQFLLIGETSGIEKAMQQDVEDQKAGDREEPIEEMEKLEYEDNARMRHLSKDESAAIFTDLEASARSYPELQTTF